MDWQRSKVVFIILFACLDALLGWQWWQLRSVVHEPSLTFKPAALSQPSPPPLQPLEVETDPPPAPSTLVQAPDCPTFVGGFSCTGSIAPGLMHVLGAFGVAPSDALEIGTDCSAVTSGPVCFSVQLDVPLDIPLTEADALTAKTVAALQPHAAELSPLLLADSADGVGWLFVEHYESTQYPIWNAFWELMVSPTGLIAKQSLWVTTEGLVSNAIVLEGSATATAAVANALGDSSKQAQSFRAVLGYYDPQPVYTPGTVWTLDPYYLVEVPQTGGGFVCYYVVAHTGQVQTVPGTQSPLSQAC